MYNLLRNKLKKELRKELKPCQVDQQSYYDIEEIRQRIVVRDDETLRVRLIRTDPIPAYRVTILKRYKASHKVKTKGGRTATLQPGIYVVRQYWIEQTPDGLMSIPPLPQKECEAHENSQKN